MFIWNAEPENGETGLHLAACKNNDKMISFLLDLGASPNMVDLKGRSPAMRAAEFGHTQALTLLAEADTDLSSKEKNGEKKYKCNLFTHRAPRSSKNSFRNVHALQD